MQNDLILNSSYLPTFEEINNYISSPGQEYWQDLNNFIQQNYKATPKITYSKCSAKPGWNVKYQKSGKSLCVLYPESAGFVALVVIPVDMKILVETMAEDFALEVLSLIKNTKPFNGTLWLMISVSNEEIVRNVKDLLVMKHPVQKSVG